MGVGLFGLFVYVCLMFVLRATGRFCFLISFVVFGLLFAVFRFNVLVGVVFALRLVDLLAVASLISVLVCSLLCCFSRC